MAKKKFGWSLYDTITDLFNIYGIGDLWDKTNTESPEKMYSKIINTINNNFDKLAEQNDSKLNRLNLIMQDLAINAPSPAFRVKIDNIKRKLNSDLDLRNDISKKIESGREVAKEAATQLLNKNYRTAKRLEKDIEKDVKDITNNVTNIINNSEELKNEI